MQSKAKFIGACRGDKRDPHSWEHTDLLYEYRGHEYIVTRHNNGYAFDSLASQHKREQERIDKIIEDAGKDVPQWTYEGSAQEGFDLFWAYVEGDVESLEEEAKA